MKRLFFGLAGGGWTALLTIKGEGLRSAVVAAIHLYFRGAGLGVPASEPAQINLAGILQGSDKILTGRRLTIVAIQIEANAVNKSFSSEQGFEHTDDLSTLVVDGRGVEVVDFNIRLRTHRMRHGASIFGKLILAQQDDIINPLDRSRLNIGGKLLVAQHGQPFFQAELKPVTAGDAITGPVVKILMGNNRLNTQVIAIGCRFRAGKHRYRVRLV